MAENKNKGITADNFWQTDLAEIEASFLPEGKVITDLPVRNHELSKVTNRKSKTTLN